MSDPKPFASLSSGLLARKGAAKPAMRPQGFGYGSLEDLGWNDMGNVDPFQPEHVPSSISALTPASGGRGPQPFEPLHQQEHIQAIEPDQAHEQDREQPHHQEQAHDFEQDEAEAFVEPAVIEQQRQLEASFETPVIEPSQSEDEIEPVQVSAPVVSLPRRKAPSRPSAPAAPAALSGPAKAKSAFTLRLDPDRHLRLRLACAVTRRSAQQIVTGALDEYLSSLPELDALAERVPAGKAARQ
jgi:hypothetical protein